MPDKTYTTSLEIQSNDTHVDRLYDKLKKLADLIDRLNQNPLGPGGGSGGGGPGGGGPGGGGGGGGGPGPGGGGGGGGGGPGPGGPGPGGGGGGGGRGPGGVRGRADLPIPVDEQQALMLPLSILNIIGLGAVGRTIGRDYFSTANKAISLDAARSASRGLYGGRFTGADLYGRGFDVGPERLGFTPTETEGFVRQTAGAGLDPRQSRALSLRAMQFERLGIGAGAAINYGAMFRPGGGAVGDASQQIGIAYGEAIQSGIRRARIPEYLEKIAGATTSMRDKGVDIDPVRILEMAALVRGVAGKGAPELAGDRPLSFTTNAISKAQQVAAGGGTPFDQYMMLRAVHIGEIDPKTGQRIDYGEALGKMEAGEIDMAYILGEFQRLSPGDAATLMDRSGYGGYRENLRLMRGERVGSVGGGVSSSGRTYNKGIAAGLRLAGMSKKRAIAFARLGGTDRIESDAEKATSNIQRGSALLEQMDTEAGEGNMDEVMRMRLGYRGVRSKMIKEYLGPAVESIMGFFWPKIAPAEKPVDPHDAAGSVGGSTRKSRFDIELENIQQQRLRDGRINMLELRVKPPFDRVFEIVFGEPGIPS